MKRFSLLVPYKIKGRTKSRGVTIGGSELPGSYERREVGCIVVYETDFLGPARF